MKNKLMQAIHSDTFCSLIMAAPMCMTAVLTYGWWLYKFYDSPNIWTIIGALAVPFFAAPVIVGLPIALTIRYLRQQFPNV